MVCCRPDLAPGRHGSETGVPSRRVRLGTHAEPMVQDDIADGRLVKIRVEGFPVRAQVLLMQAVFRRSPAGPSRKSIHQATEAEAKWPALSGPVVHLYRPATNKSGVSASPGAYWYASKSRTPAFRQRAQHARRSRRSQPRNTFGMKPLGALSNQRPSANVC